MIYKKSEPPTAEMLKTAERLKAAEDKKSEPERQNQIDSASSDEKDASGTDN